MTTVSYDSKKPRFADVSHYHPVTSWANYKGGVKAAPILAFKVGGDAPDPTAAAHKAGCKANGIIGIGYWFGALNAAAFLNAFPPEDGFIPCWDFEGYAHPSQASELVKLHTAWGRWPWFYGHSTWIAQGQPTGTAVENCPYWGPTYGSALTVPNGVGKPTAFQFTDGVHGPTPHTFPGVSGNCDINSLLVAYGDVQTQAGIGTTPSPGGDDVALTADQEATLAWEHGYFFGVEIAMADHEAGGTKNSSETTWGPFQKAGYNATMHDLDDAKRAK